MSLVESPTYGDDEETVPIVDCDVLEAAKENIQPLAGGRRVTALSAIFSTPHAQRDARLAASRAQHRAAVDAALAAADSDAEAPEALEAYASFVHWTIEHYPQGHSAESGILELLEEATRTLKDDVRCRRDVRYLKLWVLYASYVERPAVIYAFLLANEIGAAHAMLYEEYALALERDGRRTQADGIYLLGIARRAEPLEHLQNRHRDFQKRMMSSAADADAQAAPPPSTTTRRAVLGTAATSSTAASRGAPRRMAVFTDAGAAMSATSSTEDVFGGASASTSRTSMAASNSSTSTSSRPKSNSRMQVFVDPDGVEDEAGEGNAWPELGTRKTRVKENIREPTKLAGTTLKQAGVRGAAARIVPFRDPEPTREDTKSMPPPSMVPKTPAKGAFVPFRDDAEGDRDPALDIPATPTFMPFRDETTVTSPLAPVPDSVMRQKGAKASSEAEALRKDPFKNYKDQVEVDV